MSLPDGIRIFLFAVVLSIPAAAHDLYLVSGIHGAEDAACARIGEQFPVSTNGLTADRVELFRTHDAEGAKELFGKEQSTQFCAALRKTPAMVEMVVRPRKQAQDGMAAVQRWSGE